MIRRLLDWFSREVYALGPQLPDVDVGVPEGRSAKNLLRRSRFAKATARTAITFALLAAFAFQPTGPWALASHLVFIPQQPYVLLRYEPGQFAALGGTFSRGGTGIASYVDANGVVQTTSDIRENHYIGGIRHLLLEGQRTNLCLQSEALSTWSATGTPGVTDNAVAASVAGVALSEVVDDDAGLAEYVYKSCSFTGDGVKAFSFFWKKHASEGPNGATIILRDDATSTGRAWLVVKSNGTAPSVTMNTGTLIRTVALAGGVYRIEVASTAVTAANTNTIRIYATVSGTAAETGSLYIGGVQCEDATFPSSYIKTTTGTATRSADVAYLPWLWSPRAMTMYVDFTEMGSASVSSARLLQIGNSLNDAPNTRLYNAGTTYATNHLSGGNVSSAMAAAPTIGQRCELRGMLNADGSVRTGQSIADAAEVVAAQSAANAFTPWSAPTRLYMNSIGTAATGFVAIRKIIAFGDANVSRERCRAA